MTDAGGAEVAAGDEVGNPWRFQGRRWDAESGLYFFRARHLDPGLGRFVTRDPLGLWGDPANLGNPYAFVHCDPVNVLDPLGLGGWDIFAGVAQVIGGVAEIGIGIAAAAAGGPLGFAAGVVAIGHGIDTLAAGVHTLQTGTVQQTMTQQLVEDAARNVTSPTGAKIAGVAADVVLGLGPASVVARGARAAATAATTGAGAVDDAARASAAASALTPADEAARIADDLAKAAAGGADTLDEAAAAARRLFPDNCDAGAELVVKATGGTRPPVPMSGVGEHVVAGVGDTFVDTAPAFWQSVLAENAAVRQALENVPGVGNAAERLMAGATWTREEFALVQEAIVRAGGLH